MTAALLRLACIDADAPPLFGLAAEGRHGFEPEIAGQIADELNRDLAWVYRPWNDLLPAVRRHEADAVLCGQGVIPSRQEQVDFTRPYGIFHEAVLTRRDDAVLTPGPGALKGKRVAAIAGSANERLALTFEGAQVVPFESDDVYSGMLAALRSGDVDAVVDDDVVFVPLGESDPGFEVAFVVKTANPWAIGVAKDRPGDLAAIDTALAAVITDGRHRVAWDRWLPTLEYPFDSQITGTHACDR